METATGAFILSAALIILTAMIRPLGRLIERIPTSIAAAMLAGVLFGFVIDIFDHLESAPYLILPLLVLFLITRMFSPSWAVLIVLGTGVVLSLLLDMVGPINPLEISNLVIITPQFEGAVLLGVGVPLYLVTMASQNLPGFAVLKASGYAPPGRSILGVTGIASLLSAPFGAHATNLAAITASICTGEDAHPDKSKRWLCGPVYALGYGALALVSASIVSLFSSFPQALIITIAGIALAGPFVASLSSSLEVPENRFTAITTFMVTASGFSAFGLASAFWGLLAGLLVLGLEKMKK